MMKIYTITVVLNTINHETEFSKAALHIVHYAELDRLFSLWEENCKILENCDFRCIWTVPWEILQGL